MTNIAHINLFDYQGGAARIAWTLMEGMTAEGHNVRTFAHRQTQADNRVIVIPFPKTLWQKKLLTMQTQKGLFDLYSAALLKVIGHPFFAEADIIHLHCINAGYFSFFLLPFLAAKPLVWTMHDPLAFTAGCLQPDSCSKWQEGLCVDCPLGNAGMPGMRQTELLQQLKSDIYKLADFVVACPSEWLKQHAAKGIMREKDIRLIKNGIDTVTFQPKDKIGVRKKLGLPVDKKIVMFAAHGGFNNRLKGGHLLIKALQQLARRYPDLVLVNIGTYDNRVLEGVQLELINLPYISEQQVMAEYYGAADVFVSPSMAENLSLVICEAMASGVPVAAFHIGGNPEIIDHQENGYLAKAFEVEDLAAGITWLLKNTKAYSIDRKAREKIIKYFNARTMVENYSKLYEEILQKNAGK